jgi:hypothetical protein
MTNAMTGQRAIKRLQDDLLRDARGAYTAISADINSIARLLSYDGEQRAAARVLKNFGHIDQAKEALVNALYSARMRLRRLSDALDDELIVAASENALFSQA